MLRHPLGPFTDDAVDRSKEPDTIVPKLPPPFKVTFRRDGDIGSVIDAVKQHPRVNICAAMASGKSTRIPIALAERLGLLVVHTIPAHHSARRLTMYLNGLSGGERFTYMTDITADLPQRGVVIMTTGYFFSRMCTDRFGQCPEFLLYMDENHESDSCTAVMRRVASSYSCVKHMVFATATNEPGSDLTTVTPGKSKVVTYQRQDTTTWSANDIGKPWSASSIDGHMAIFLERPATVKRMKTEYEDHGFIVRVVGARVSDEEVDKALAATSSRNNNGIVILFLEYSCRSSLTIPNLSYILESGEVQLASVVDGAPAYIYRDAFDFEIQQGLNRAGRCEGDNVIMYKPADRPKMKMCDLETLEGDAANLMYRMLGFRPPLECGIFNEAIGPVPKDLVGALQGDTPLRLYPPESREPWVRNNATSVLPVRSVSAYKFKPNHRVGPRPVSCRTVLDDGFQATPSPKFDRLNAIEEVDFRSFSDYANERENSPTLSPVRTISTRSFDNLSVLTDEECPVFAKPKRVAKRVVEERQAKQAMDKQLPEVPVQDLSVLSGDINSSSGRTAVELADKVLEVRGQANKVFDEMARSATHVKKNMQDRGFANDLGQSQTVRELLNSTRAENKNYAISDETMGTYYYYHGLDAAPNISAMFINGYDSVVQFCQNGRAREYAKVLPERDKLYAVKVLLERYNKATARVYGIQRIICEIRDRKKEDFQDLLRPDLFNDTLRWALNENNIAKADILLSRSLITPFLDRPLDKLDVLQKLEQDVMHEVVKKFEYAAVVKDPDKMLAYFDQLNGQQMHDLQDDRLIQF